MIVMLFLGRYKFSPYLVIFKIGSVCFFLTMFIFIYYKLLFNSQGKVEFDPVGDNMQNSTGWGDSLSSAHRTWRGHRRI